MEKNSLVAELKKRMLRYKEEKERITEALLEGQKRLDILGGLIYSCEQMLREEGITDFGVVQMEPIVTHSIVKASATIKTTEEIVLSTIEQNPEGLTPRDVMNKIKEAGHEIGDKTVYNALFTLKHDHKLRKEGSKYYLPE